MADRIQIRRDTAANWTSASPTLANGELGLETDTGKLKVGDGSTIWTSLGYYTLGTTGVAMYSDATANFTGDLQKSGVSVPAYSDTTANFTGALQKSGVPVAADANLNSFLSAVDLPTADGSADQVLTTTGSGTLLFADAAGGVTYDNWSGGTTADIDLRTSADISASRNVSSPGYMQLWRVGSSVNSNHTVGNTFSFISGNHDANSQCSMAACGFVVTPSTKTITVTTPTEIWSNQSGFGISTWAGTGADGGGEMVCHGNIAWPGQPTYRFGYAIYRQSDVNGSNVNNTMGGYTGDSHHNNDPRFSLPYNAAGATRAFVFGYNQNNSNRASYRTYSGAGHGQGNGSVSSVYQCPNTNTSTCEAVNMFTHPLITDAGLFPNSGGFNLPTQILAYGTSNGYSKIGIDAGNNVGAEVTTGFNRQQYSSQCAFLVKDPSSSNLKLFNYDYYGQICEWTSTTQTYDRGTLGQIPFNLNGNKYMIVPTGNLNEYLILNGATSYPYYGPYLMFKFTINYSDGKFSNIKVYDASKNTDMMPYNNSYVYAKALYGDNADISSAPTNILLAGLIVGNVAFAQVLDYPADSLFTAL